MLLHFTWCLSSHILLLMDFLTSASAVETGLKQHLWNKTTMITLSLLTPSPLVHKNLSWKRCNQNWKAPLLKTMYLVNLKFFLGWEHAKHQSPSRVLLVVSKQLLGAVLPPTD